MRPPSPTSSPRKPGTAGSSYASSSPPWTANSPTSNPAIASPPPEELLQRGFDYAPDDAEAAGSCQATAEPEPDPAEIEAQRRLVEDIKFSLHSPVYYQTNPYPCVCEDRLHNCKGNVLDAEQREQAARKGPGNQFFIGDPDRMDDFLARYAE